MAIAVLFEFPNEQIEKYDRALELAPHRADQPDRSVHVCFKTENGVRVLDVWESPEAIAKFGELLGPVMQEIGLSATPRIYEVHNTI